MTPRTTPYEVGQKYRVPCVRGKWSTFGSHWWPVNGPLHDDGQFLNFPWDHWHVDHRFVTAAKWRDGASLERGSDFRFYSLPLHTMFVEPFGYPKPVDHIPYPEKGDADAGTHESAEVVRQRRAKFYLDTLPRKSWYQLRRKVCLRQYVHIPDLAKFSEKLREGFTDSRLDLKRRICPHKGTDLRTIPVVNGVIQCPLHGLQFCATTGRAVWPSIDG